jgi:glycosyltransferase involved in cell wall biosynthesis
MKKTTVPPKAEPGFPEIPITIVSLNGDDNSGGVERVVYYLKNILSEHYSVSIMKREGKHRKTDKIIYPIFFSLKLLFCKNTLIISNSWQSFLFPVDFSIHHGATAGYMEAAQMKSIGSSCIAFMEKISARRAKTVIAVSENCKKELEELYKIDSKKIFVLNNFVDEKLFFPEKVEPHKTTRILFSGRLEERKGLSKLLELALFLESKPNYELCIAVNSKNNSGLFSKFKNTHVYYGLDIPGMRKFYSSGDIFYFPTQYEGFSMATLEALASGIPVIGTKFAVPEELRRYDFVKIFEAENLSLLLEGIDDLVQKNKSRRHEIFRTVIRDFGYEQYRDKLFSLVTKSNEN